MSDAVVWILLLIMTAGTLFASIFIFQVKGLVVRILDKANAEDTARALTTQTLKAIEKNGIINKRKDGQVHRVAEDGALGEQTGS